MNVTQKVVAKYEEGVLKLFMDGAKIGEVVETDHGLQHSMKEGFAFEADAIYRYEHESPEQITSFIEDSWQYWD
ncbi:DUF2553 family protein [Shouchella shacheensis]|uniref:DUF2553 family protein n=1 Tax=Shouchella shacheensis TaxID=1649580 RepID=UPI001FDF4F73|nr:DUF2553 family protein [Shouchella shacheensis]